MTENNLRLFTTLIYSAQRRISLTSPYFVPDESLLYAVTTAAQRGIQVELFVSEQSDQFMVGHAQASYYRALLEAGVRIYLYPSPWILHSKHFTIDDDVAVIGSSNMDMRSFALNYEISMLCSVGSGGNHASGRGHLPRALTRAHAGGVVPARAADAVRRQRDATDGGAAVNRRVEKVLKNSWFRSLAMLVLVLVVYFALPVEEDLNGPEITLRLVPVMLGILGAGVLVVRELTPGHGGDRRQVRLVLVLEIVMVGFAMAYFIIAENTPEEFAELHTKIDALYFAIATTATVGFGDVHAQGQVARALVTVQMAFSVGFLAAVTALFRKQLSERQDAREARADRDDDGSVSP